MPLPADVLDCLGHAVVVTDRSGRVTSWNPAAEKLFGWPASDALGRPVTELFVPESMRAHLGSVIEQLQYTGIWSGAFTARRRDGSTFLAYATNADLRGASGNVEGIVTVAFELGEVANSLLHRSREAAIITDDDGIVLFANPAITALTGWNPSDLVGTSWWDRIHEMDRSRAVEAHAVAIRTDALLPPVEQRVLRPDGTAVWVDASKTNLLDVPTVHGVLVTLRDVTERRERVDELTNLALHDSLTGLLNQAVFREHLEAHLARRLHSGAVLYIDLDGFKDINDRHGHEAGDAVLRAVARRLQATLRPEDICARLGGDEFAILSPDVTSPELATALAQRVRTSLSQPLQVGHVALRPGASVGVALLASASDAEHALRLADADMYQHKHGDQTPPEQLPPAASPSRR